MAFVNTPTDSTSATRLSAASRRAFTLIEVMISIALALFLMVGINAIFKMTGDAVGASQTISDQVREARSAQSVIGLDLKRLTPNAPLVINMVTQGAFRNLADKLADVDGDPLTVDLNDNGTEGETTIPGERISASNYASRNSRLDTLSFFATGTFHRQTGGIVGVNPGPLIAEMSGGEAWIWFGHLSLLNNTSLTGPIAFAPAAPDTTIPKTIRNDNNQYASQWVLGREQFVLMAASGNAIKDRNGKPQEFIFSGTAQSSLGYGALQFGGTNYLQSSRYDLCDTTIDRMNAMVESRVTAMQPWWINLFGVPATRPPRELQRFEAASYLIRPGTPGNSSTTLVSPDSFARLQPAFIPGCTQFIVEFAGDFLKQDAQGNVTDVYAYPVDPMKTGDPGNANGSTDGVTDYVVIDPGLASETRQTRWYGLPRDTDESGTIINDVHNGDVMPLINAIKTKISATQGAPFEKAYPDTKKLDYAKSGPTLGLDKDEYYTAAFTAGDRKPTMIRITVVLDDPLVRLPSGQTFEFIYKLDSVNND